MAIAEDRAFIKLALRSGVLSKEQAEELRRRQDRGGPHWGGRALVDIAIGLGYLDAGRAEQLRRHAAFIARRWKDKAEADEMLRRGWIRPEAAERALSEQKSLFEMTGKYLAWHELVREHRLLEGEELAAFEQRYKECSPGAGRRGAPLHRRRIHPVESSVAGEWILWRGFVLLFCLLPVVALPWYVGLLVGLVVGAVWLIVAVTCLEFGAGAQTAMARFAAGLRSPAWIGVGVAIFGSSFWYLAHWPRVAVLVGAAAAATAALAWLGRWSSRDKLRVALGLFGPVVVVSLALAISLRWRSVEKLLAEYRQSVEAARANAERGNQGEAMRCIEAALPHAEEYRRRVRQMGWPSKIQPDELAGLRAELGAHRLAFEREEAARTRAEQVAEIRGEYRRAEAALQAGRWEEAVRVFGRVLQLAEAYLASAPPSDGARPEIEQMAQRAREEREIAVFRTGGPRESIASVREAVARFRPAVVYIQVQMGRGNVSMGSGFVISPEGYVVTNRHVIEGGRSFVVGWDESVRRDRVTADLVAFSSTDDLALLRIRASNLVAAPVAWDRAPEVGSQAVVMGFPVQQVLGTSSVSAFDGTITGVGPFRDGIWGERMRIRTNALTAHGNSGGPLIDLELGAVVGVVTRKGAVYTVDGVTQQVPEMMAVPVSEIRNSFPRLFDGRGYATAIQAPGAYEPPSLPAGPQVPGAVGGRIRGWLGPGDNVDHSGRYFDAYNFQGFRGQRITITLSSSDFDPVLWVSDSRGPDYYLRVDDDSGGGTASRLELLLPADATYVIGVTSFRPASVGSYELVITR